MKPLAYRLRHRVDIESVTQTRDAHGGVVDTWAPIQENVPAEIVPLSGREFIAAQSIQAGINTRITIRLTDIDAKDRIKHGDTIYSIKVVLPDPTLARHVTLMCEAGVNDG